MNPSLPSRPQPESQISSAPLTPQTTTRSRGSNYTSLEDCALSRACIKASEDPIIGSEQKSLTFFTKIAEVFDQLKPPTSEQRSMESLKSRCKLINKECVKFTGCINSVRRSKPTGVSDDDIHKMATALYNGVKIHSASDNCGRTFKFLSSWLVLKDHQKFAGGQSQSRDSQIDTSTGESGAVVLSDGNDASNNNSDKRSKERPIGRRKAKDSLSKADSAQKKLRLAQVAIDLQKARNESLDHHNEILLFSHAPVQCSNADTIEYFNLLRAEALKKARKRAAPSAQLVLQNVDAISDDVDDNQISRNVSE